MVLRGKQAVSEAWPMYFAGPEAPFSWEPDTVEVLESGALALSSGPAHDSLATLVATNTSIWKQEEPGIWRIVLDQGNRACPPSTAENPEPTEQFGRPDGRLESNLPRVPNVSRTETST